MQRSWTEHCNPREPCRGCRFQAGCVKPARNDCACRLQLAGRGFSTALFLYDNAGVWKRRREHVKIGLLGRRVGVNPPTSALQPCRRMSPFRVGLGSSITESGQTHHGWQQGDKDGLVDRMHTDALLGQALWRMCEVMMLVDSSRALICGCGTSTA